MNLTSLQVKIGNEYFPPLPITGCAGNSFVGRAGGGYANHDYGSNSEFIINLFKATGYLWDENRRTAINPYNYAISGRDYDPSVRRFNLSNADDNRFAWGGAYWWRENIYCGKAIFGINMESFAKGN